MLLYKLESLSYLAVFLLTALSAFIIVPQNLHLLVLSVSIIYIGSVLSLKLKYERIEKGHINEETITTNDAYMFPVFGSCVLFGLYLLFKFIDKDWINYCVSIYFGLIGIYSLIKTFSPLVTRCPCIRGDIFSKKVSLPIVGSFTLSLGKTDALLFLPACFISYKYFQTQHFILNNILAICFAIQGIERLSLGSYKVGCILLCGLFFYDIFWVFGTDVMVTVAKTFNAPIKLLFEKPTSDAKGKYSMLGLGDIVIPGIFIALLLRYDAHRANILHYKDIVQQKVFCAPYFFVNIIFYAIGLALTVIIMTVFGAAQPALLYLVPACVGSSFVTSLYLKDLKKLLLYTEEEDKEEAKKEMENEKEGKTVEAKKDK